jgi:hypothetical protein
MKYHYTKGYRVICVGDQEWGLMADKWPDFPAALCGDSGNVSFSISLINN